MPLKVNPTIFTSLLHLYNQKEIPPKNTLSFNQSIEKIKSISFDFIYSLTKKRGILRQDKNENYCIIFTYNFFTIYNFNKILCDEKNGLIIKIIKDFLGCEIGGDFFEIDGEYENGRFVIYFYRKGV